MNTPFGIEFFSAAFPWTSMFPFGLGLGLGLGRQSVSQTDNQDRETDNQPERQTETSVDNILYRPRWSRTHVLEYIGKQ
jgi:hypothetical protein